MPSLKAFLQLAPFSVDELVDSTNSVLRDRPRLLISKRTVRYYVSERILPPPGGSPKFARYGADHFLRLIAARCLLDTGKTLDECRLELVGVLSGTLEENVERVQAMVDGNEIAPSQVGDLSLDLEIPDQDFDDEPTVVKESLSPIPQSQTVRRRGAIDPGVMVRRIHLGNGITIEGPGELPQAELMETAYVLIRRAMHATRQ